MAEISYIFEMPQETVEYRLLFDEDWQLIVQPQDKPNWTRLSHHPCKDCPLLQQPNCSHCPLALGVAEILEAFKNEISCEKALITVKAPEREYRKETTIQDGLQSLLGLTMATSACPRMAFLRPMARFHLPFASLDETMVRALSFFFLKQFFHHGEATGAFTMERFQAQYRSVIEVNQGLLGRIRDIDQTGDADQNAIIILDGFARLLLLNFDSDYQSLMRFFPKTDSETQASPAIKAVS
ncbi:DUF6901 family protein [Pseudobacteriovorax antillogorgiicola]|uniref:Uncharacterized protein n=1 Tax=Pseudobacteriovorax antillogorgiicola TaxID=1513793 RepID=A0A1Y6CFB2_9BACT|nr:hypothetical protein [Pseudobacteriovorax antillogorgiicola]TCS47232.1 hypothetical protein EDD56_1215 [Pseudobacteriovorax antillogorgiicola]SMF61935.1 hypothetical protein SAMN06296036_1215 [Pseudobacteriovorax antillogorgiicola]